ncbi:MAG: hypothetical protein J07HX64_02436 [halophilic archaeon J07HX64]|nr:MAG: hypothetical protein J07HX64_02436 [halophilic archaeon J07HX64]
MVARPRATRRLVKLLPGVATVDHRFDTVDGYPVPVCSVDYRPIDTTHPFYRTLLWVRIEREQADRQPSTPGARLHNQ